MMNKILIISLLLLLPAYFSKAQDQRDQERGEIRDTEFIIRKDRVLTLPNQTRVLEKPPALPSTSSHGNYTYTPKNFFLDLAPVQLDIQPFARNFRTSPPNTYHSYTKLGFGNYRSPLAEIHINNIQNEDMNLGLFLKHQGFYDGPVDGANSAEDHTKVRLDGSLFKDNVEFFGKLGYDRDRHNFYGYTQIPSLEIDPDDISQIFNTLYGTAGLRKIDRLDVFDFNASLSVRLFNDNYFAREHEAGLKADIGLRANENLSGGILSRIYYTSPSDVTYSDINRNYFKLTPFAKFLQGGLELKIGANIIHENDVVPNKNVDFHIFPTFFASYHITPEFGVYGSYEGDVIRNTYYGFAMENPFLGPSSQLRNTIQNFQVDAGVKGAINSELSYKAGFKYGDFSNLHFFANNPSDSTRFQLIYDDQTRIVNYHAGVNWNYDDVYRLKANLNYYQYSLTELEGPWHRPEWDIQLQNSFTPNSRWILSANAHLMGGIAALNLASGRTTTLNTIIDLSARADYALSQQFSVFMVGNNLLNQNYQRFWNYPVRGIQGIGGISFKF